MTATRDPLKRRIAEVLSRRLALIVAAGALAVLALLIGLPMAQASSPAFSARYHELAADYENLQTSSHKGLPCAACHRDSRGPVVRDLAGVADFYANILGGRKTPLFMTFESPTSAACLGCHREEWSDEASRTAKVPHPAHQRVASETRPCVQCHKWTAHEETYMQKHKTMPFSGVCVAYGCHVGTKQTEECANCHHSLAKADWKLEHPKAVAEAGPNGCLESCHEIDQCRLCHTTGKQPKVSGPAVQTGLESIQSLHVRKDWVTQHGTVADKDQAQCMKCHVSDGECRECHSHRPKFHGSEDTWIGTHKDVSKGREQRCTGTCHQKNFCDDCHKQFKEMR